MGIPFYLRVVPLPPPPERPPTQLLAVLLPHLPNVPIQGWVELPPSSHHLRVNRSISVDRVCPPDGVVTFGRIPIRKEETGSTLCMVRPNLCVRAVQQGLHLAGEHIKSKIPALKELNLYTVFLVVPPLSPLTYSSPVRLPLENSSINWSVGGHPSPLAQ